MQNVQCVSSERSEGEADKKKNEARKISSKSSLKKKTLFFFHLSLTFLFRGIIKMAFAVKPLTARPMGASLAGMLGEQKWDARGG